MRRLLVVRWLAVKLGLRVVDRYTRNVTPSELSGISISSG